MDKNYAPISKKAARNILYFLKKGVVYGLAVILAGVKNCLGDKWESIAEQDERYVINSVLGLYSQNKNDGFVPKLLRFLEEEM